MINHKKAYLLGLLAGGGKISNEAFTIELPFAKWGMDPKNMNMIANDILTKISAYFKDEYNFNATYEIGNKRWIIKPVQCSDINCIKDDLSELGLPTMGFLLHNADLTIAKRILTGIAVESFLSGIFDTRGSLAASHRRFNDHAPTVSLEIPGSTNNFKFVVQLCSWLTELGSITDQILYNHPCQHSAADPTYKNWKKGFKIRFLIKSFITNHSFAMKSKSFDANKIEEYQKVSDQTPCISRRISTPSPVSIHIDINSTKLPIDVRNKLFFHYLHFCAVLGCPFAPLQEVKNIVKDACKYISVFPRLSKGNADVIFSKYESITKKYLFDSEYETIQFTVKEITRNADFQEYKELSSGLAYLLSPVLNGKRHIGSQNKIIESNDSAMIKVIKPKLIFSAPICLFNPINQRAIIISTVVGEFNTRVVKPLFNIENLEVILR